MDRAKKKIAIWYLYLMRRLFGRNYTQRISEQRFDFLLLPESAYGYLHFHGLIHIPPSHLEYFHRLASTRWIAVAPRGEMLCAPIGPTTEDRERWFTYITKGSLASEVLHSSMLDLPDAHPSALENQSA